MGLWECAASIVSHQLDTYALTHPACKSISLQGRLLVIPCCSFLLISRSFLLHQSPNRTVSLPIPRNIVVIYVVVCSCPWSSHPVFGSSIPTFFSIFFPLPISTNPNLPKLNGYLLTLVSNLDISWRRCHVLFFFHAQYSLTMS